MVAADNINISRDIAQVETAKKRSGKEIIIDIQDSHASLSAQYSIVEILKKLMEDYKVDVVAIEGSSGFIDTTVFSSIPDKNIKEKTAAYLMKESMISAGEFFSVMNDSNVALYGVEDSALYEANLKSFREIYSKNKDVIGLVDKTLEELSPAEKKIYGNDLGKMVFKSRLHRDGKISFEVYWDFIEKFCSERKIVLTGTDNIDKFRSLSALERNIDFTKATLERKMLITSLMEISDKQELGMIVLESLSFDKGKINEVMYHKWLLDFAKSKKIDITAYPELLKYYEYIEKYTDIDIVGLQDETERIESSIITSLISTGSESDLYRLTDILRMVKGLFEIKLSSLEVNRLRGEIDVLSGKASRDILNRYAKNSVKDDDVQRIVSESKKSLVFYDIAHKRDEAMINNTIQAMRREGKSVAALITGGHHSSGLSDLMNRNGLSYLILMPKYSKEITRPYVAILTKKSGPYSELVKTGSYDLALPSVLGDGSVEDITKGLAYAIGQNVLGGGDAAIFAEDLKREYRSAYDGVSPERRVATRRSPFSPDIMDVILGKVSAEKITEGTVRVIIGDAVYDVTNFGVTYAGKIKHEIGTRYIEKVVDFIRSRSGEFFDLDALKRIGSGFLAPYRC